MHKLLILVALLLGLLAGPAAAQGQEKQGDTHAQESAGHAPSKPTLEMANDHFFKVQYEHSVPYPIVGEPGDLLAFWNVNKFQVVALVLMLLVFVPIRYSFGKRGGWFTRVFRGWCLWIRDEMVYAVMGKEEGRAFAPYFIFLFFFVTFMNVVGLVPSTRWFSTYTATGTPYVTGALAVITFVTMIAFGMKKNGVFGFIKGLLPHGLPAWLIPLMLVVEIVGLLVKPFALTIRLFANMLAGHLVIASLVGLIFLFAKMQGGAFTSYLTAVPALGMTIFIFIIEAFVTLLQAYIFTYLSIIFLHQAMHQEH